MKVRSNIYALALTAGLMCGLTAGAQVPGYMGKRTMVGYGLNFNPAFTNVVLGYGDNPINALHEVFLEHTVSKKISLGLSAEFYRYTYNNVEDVDAIGYYSSTIKQIDANPKGSYAIRARNFSFYSKFFRRRYLAPWGKYFFLGLMVTSYQTSYNPTQMKVRIEETVYTSSGRTPVVKSTSDFGPREQSFQTADLFFGNGTRRIFANRITLDYGYQINVVAMSSLMLRAVDLSEADDINDYIQNTSRRRVAAMNRFNFYLKVGYLF